MNKEFQNNLIKHGLAVVFLAIVTLLYFKPLLDGKDVRQSDMLHFEGMSKELKDYHQQTGDYSYWTNAMFSGMPSAYIYSKPDPNVFYWMELPIQKGTPMMSYGIIFMMLLCFYIAMSLLGLNVWLSIGASLAYAFCSYNLIIIEAGHITKAYAIATIPLVLSGAILAYGNKKIAGAVVLMIGFGLSLANSHPQITYYTGLALAAYVLVAFIYACIEKKFVDFLKSSALVLAAVLIAIMPNFGGLYTNYDYSKESMRGKSELQAKSDNSSGLEYNYAYAWSYGKMESLTLLVPNAKGGTSHFSSMEEIEEKMPNTLNTLRTERFDKSPDELLQQCSVYWGEQPFTSGPVYAGAIVCLLFVFSLFVVKGKMRLWALIVFLCSIVLAWGKNFPAINDLMFNYFPFFDKFRTPSMILVLTTFIMAFMGFYGLKTLIDKSIDKKQLLKYLGIATGITGALTFLIAIMPTMFLNFTGQQDAGLPASLLSALQMDRQAMCTSDAWRSFFFILVAAALLWLWIKEKLKPVIAVVAISLLTLVDLWTVDKRYLNDDDFDDIDKLMAKTYALTPADMAIKEDNSFGSRVLNLASNPFNDSHASYYHHAIGGYHGAKMRRYQEFVDSVMMDQIYLFTSTFNTVAADDSLRNDLLSKMTALNMLDAKYFIFNYQTPPFINTAAYGQAWFVDEVMVVDNATEELLAMRSIDPRKVAVMDKNFAVKASPKSEKSTIELVEMTSNKCKYNVNAQKDELAVFSQIYYPYWQVKIDGKEANLLRANYILRSLEIPQGKHLVEFEFVPTKWTNASIVSLISSVFVLLLLLALAGYYYYYLPKKNKE